MTRRIIAAAVAIAAIVSIAASIAPAQADAEPPRRCSHFFRQPHAELITLTLSAAPADARPVIELAPLARHAECALGRAAERATHYRSIAGRIVYLELAAPHPAVAAFRADGRERVTPAGQNRP